MSTSNIEGILNERYDYGKIKKFDTDKLLKDIEEISEEKQLEAYFKDNLNSMLESISNTRKVVLDKKSEVEELKFLLKEKAEEARKAVKNAERTSSRKKEALQKEEQARRELETIRRAMENIENATRDLTQNEANMARESLRPVLVKKTATSEKADAELKAMEQLEIETAKKAKKLENEFIRLEEEYNRKFEEARNFASNITTTINHIVTSFGELVDVAKNLLESSITVNSLPENIQSSNLNETESTNSLTTA